MTKLKPGRPRSDNPRRNRISVSFTDMELSTLMLATDGDLSTFLRDAALFRANTLIRAYSASQ